MGINSNTENLIQIFLKYGIKKSLSVEEFIQFREQAMKEQLSGIVEDDSNNYKIDPTNVSSECHQPIVETISQKRDIPQKSDIVEQKEIISHKNDAIEQKVNKPSNINPTDDEIDNEENSSEDFNDEAFLKMMRDIED